MRPAADLPRVHAWAPSSPAAGRRRQWSDSPARCDCSSAGRGDALFDLATFTLGHEEHLGDVIAGYGTDVDLDVIRAWWSLRSLLGVRWLIEHGFDPFAPGCEVDVLRARR